MKIIFKIIGVGVILYCCLIFQAKAQTVPKPIYVYGHIKGKTDSVHLLFNLWRDTYGTELVANRVTVPVDTKGNFKIFLGERAYRHHFLLQDVRDDGPDLNLIEDSYVEPGDNISVDIAIAGDKRSIHSTVRFTGKGAARMQCQQELFKLNIDSLVDSFYLKTKEFGESNISKITLIEKNKEKFVDSLIRIQLDVLNHYKSAMSLQMYNTIRADVIGRALGNVGFARIGFLLIKSVYPINVTERLFLQHQQHFHKYFITDPLVISYSTDYMRFLLNKEEEALAIRKGGHSYELKDWYKYLNRKYQGYLKESFLTFYFMSVIKGRHGGPFIPAVDPDQYKWALEQTYKNMNNRWLKNILAIKLRTTKGSIVHDFNLPRDSTSSFLKLSDLRGKVVLLDMSAFRCGACEDFATVFHQKIFPRFKNNPNFAYVSIMQSQDVSRKRYIDYWLKNLDPQTGLPLQINESDTRPTFPEYINLYGGGNDDIYNMFKEFGGQNPFILLLDKKGKVYASYVPFFTNANNPNIQKLTDLIEEALAEKD